MMSLVKLINLTNLIIILLLLLKYSGILQIDLKHFILIL